MSGCPRSVILTLGLSVLSVQVSLVSEVGHVCICLWTIFSFFFWELSICSYLLPPLLLHCWSFGLCGFRHSLYTRWTSQVALVVKNLAPVVKPVQKTRVSGLIPGWGRSPGERNGNPPSILAWRISWTEQPGGLQSIRSQRVRHN